MWPRGIVYRALDLKLFPDRDSPQSFLPNYTSISIRLGFSTVATPGV